LEKIEEMLLEISLRKAARETTSVPEASSPTINNACVINHDKGKNVLKHSDTESDNSEESNSDESHSSTDDDLQFEERVFQNQFSVSADKLYEWNIDGLSE